MQTGQVTSPLNMQSATFSWYILIDWSCSASRRMWHTWAHWHSLWFHCDRSLHESARTQRLPRTWSVSSWLNSTSYSYEGTSSVRHEWAHWNSMARGLAHIMWLVCWPQCKNATLVFAFDWRRKTVVYLHSKTDVESTQAQMNLELFKSVRNILHVSNAKI